MALILLFEFSCAFQVMFFLIFQAQLRASVFIALEEQEKVQVI